MITARSMCTETIALLLEELNHAHFIGLLLFSHAFFPSLQEEEEESWPPADWLMLVAWAATLVVESEGGLSNATETHD